MGTNGHRPGSPRPRPLPPSFAPVNKIGRLASSTVSKRSRPLTPSLHPNPPRERQLKPYLSSPMAGAQAARARTPVPLSREVGVHGVQQGEYPCASANAASQGPADDKKLQRPAVVRRLRLALSSRPTRSVRLRSPSSSAPLSAPALARRINSPRGDVLSLAGGPPCQPFSQLRSVRAGFQDRRSGPIDAFIRIRDALRDRVSVGNSRTFAWPVRQSPACPRHTERNSLAS